MKAFLNFIQGLLLVFGLLALGWCGFVFLKGSLYQRAGREALSSSQTEGSAESPGLGTMVGGVRLPPVPLPSVHLPLAQRSLVGSVEIPRIGLNAVIWEGIDDDTLERGAGHVPGTAAPGEAGNIGVAGHRDTFFRPLRKIRLKDRVRLDTKHGSYQYLVESIQVVEPEDVQVLEASHQPVLTLVTCYPFSLVGKAPKRFIVRARQVGGDSDVVEKTSRGGI